MTDLMFEKPTAPVERSTTISVSDRDLRAATQLLRTLVASDQGQTTGITTHQARCELDETASQTPKELSRRIFALRRLRAEIFGKGMFGEPAWDTLLALYMEAGSGPKLTVGQLSGLTDTPPTSAIRWLDYLEHHGLVRREPHPTDRRSVRVELTDKGRLAMEEFLSGTGL